MILHIFETAVTRAMLPGLVHALERHTRNGWKWNEYAGSIPEPWVSLRSTHLVEGFHLFLSILNDGRIETSINFPTKEGADLVSLMAEEWVRARDRMAGMMFFHYKQELKRERDALEKRLSEVKKA